MHATTAGNAALCIDWPAILERFEGDEELLREVVDLFLNDCPRRLADVRDAVARGDCALLQQSAHSLKGSLANFSVESAVQAAWRLEVMGRDRDVAAAAEAYAALEDEVTRLIAALACVR